MMMVRKKNRKKHPTCKYMEPTANGREIRFTQQDHEENKHVTVFHLNNTAYLVSLSHTYLLSNFSERETIKTNSSAVSFFECSGFKAAMATD